MQTLGVFYKQCVTTCVVVCSCLLIYIIRRFSLRVRSAALNNSVGICSKIHLDAHKG